MNEISLNMIQTLPISSVTCKKLTLRIPHLSTEENQKLFRKLYGRLGGPIYGYFEQEIIYFFGNETELFRLLYELRERFGIKFDSNIIKEVILDFKIHSHRTIFLKTFYDKLRDHFEERGFTIPRGRKIKRAIPTSFLQKQVDYALIHNDRYYESFGYNLLISEDNCIMLQIDPSISSLISFIKMKEGDYIIPRCFDTNCESFNICPVIPSNSVRFLKEEEIEFEICKGKPGRVALVFDPKKQNTLKIPIRNLFLEARPENIPYHVVRNLALKKPERRKSYIRRFIKLITDDDKLCIPLGKNKFDFSTDLISLEYSPSWKEHKDFHNYSLIPQIEVLFGDGLSKVTPFEGLKEFGTYSHNKSSDRRYTPPRHIRLFTIYPSKQEENLSEFLRILKEGKFYYLGFKANNKPYNISITIEKLPIDYQNEIDYLEKCKARIINLSQDYPWRRGYIVLCVIPSDSRRFYDDMKDFCFARNIKTQMIKAENIGRMINSAYLMYNFSISIYTKAGGTPWIIDSSYFRIADCFIGQAFSRKDIERFGPSKFFVGAADVFNAWGEHISFALHQGSVDRQIRGLNVDKVFMKELMNKSVNRYIDKVGTPRTILIHRAGKFIEQEIEAVQEVLTEKDIEKCFLVHVQHNSHFRGFDNSLNDQIRRGTLFRISSGSYLLFPTGYLTSEKKEHIMGTPKSVQLNTKIIYKDGSISSKISNEEFYEICKNYLGFTRLRWNSLSTRLREPLTIYASRKVANWLRDGYVNLEGIDIRDIL